MIGLGGQQGGPGQRQEHPRGDGHDRQVGDHVETVAADRGQTRGHDQGEGEVDDEVEGLGGAPLDAQPGESGLGVGVESRAQGIPARLGGAGGAQHRLKAGELDQAAGGVRRRGVPHLVGAGGRGEHEPPGEGQRNDRDGHDEGQRPLDERRRHQHDQGHDEGVAQTGDDQRRQVRQGVDLLGGRVDHGGPAPGVEPAQRQGQDVLGHAVDHGVADLEDAHPVGAVHGDRIDEHREGPERHDHDEPGGQGLRAPVEGAQEGDHESQGHALKDRRGDEPGEDHPHLRGIDEAQQHRPHGHSPSPTPAGAVPAWSRSSPLSEPVS